LILRHIRDPDLPARLRQWHALLAGIVSEPSGLQLIELLLIIWRGPRRE
jgi:hypothetical protein